MNYVHIHSCNSFKIKGRSIISSPIFAGLNCTDELGKVLDSFNDLLKPGGRVTLVILPKFCLWEFLLIFKGKFRTAFRRVFSSNGKSGTH